MVVPPDIHVGNRETMSIHQRKFAIRKRAFDMMAVDAHKSRDLAARMYKARNILARATDELFDESTFTLDEELKIGIMQKMSEALGLLQQAILLDQYQPPPERPEYKDALDAVVRENPEMDEEAQRTEAFIQHQTEVIRWRDEICTVCVQDAYHQTAVDQGKVQDVHGRPVTARPGRIHELFPDGSDKLPRRRGPVSDRVAMAERQATAEAIEASVRAEEY